MFNLQLCGVEEINSSFRHARILRVDDGAVQFWRIKDNLQNISIIVPRCLTTSGEKHGRWRWKQEKIQYCIDPSGTILYLRALQGHSGRNLIDSTLQDTALIPNNFFQYIDHVGCAINIHSIISSGLILGGQNLNNIQTVLSACGSHGQKT